MLGAKRLMRLVILRPKTGCISLKFALVRFEVRRRKWLLPPFVRTTLPVPVRRNRLEVALWVFSLTLPAFALRGIADCSFHTDFRQNKTADILLARGLSTSLGLTFQEAAFASLRLASFSTGACSGFSFFFAPPLPAG